jgi:hypothetical protein
MRQILCILTSDSDAIGEAVISAEKSQPDCAVQTFDLRVANPDYDRLLGEILRADSVQVW